MKFCFVILHYNGLQDTINCIESIKQLDLGQGYSSQANVGQGETPYASENEVCIQIVDNHSSNGSGADLCALYVSDASVRVLLRPENDGFSKGNNAGVMEGRAWFDPDMYIVVNNDVVFAQKDFLTTLTKIASERTDVAVFGPDIFVPATGRHQSPIGEQLPTEKQVSRTIWFNQLALLTFPITKPLLKKYFARMRSSKVQAKYETEQQDVVVMGACMIYRKSYVEERLAQDEYSWSEEHEAKPLFAPETEFYYEEYLQQMYCRANGIHTLYTPQLQVHHMDGGASKGNGRGGLEEEKEEQQMRFVLKHTMLAAKIYKNALTKSHLQ